MLLTSLLQLTGINQDSRILDIGRNRTDIRFHQNHAIDFFLSIAIKNLNLVDMA